MNITGDSNIFVRNIVDTVIKGSQFNMGAIYYGSLYVIINYGILYTVDVSNFLPMDLTCTFDNNSYKLDTECIIDNPSLFPELFQRCSGVLQATNYPMIFHDSNVRENPEFEQIVAAKTSEGSFRYYIDTSIGRTFMILYKSIFGLAKPDTLSLKVYNTDNIGYGTRLAHFIIGKKKLKININVYFYFVDMIRTGGQ